jgi:polyhydroxybutyrate depolymerase
MTTKQAVPVVFAFHGVMATPKDMKSYTGLNRTADDEGFLLIYPAGVNHSWNAGEMATIPNDEDESAFVEEILLYLKSIVNIDPKRIYAVGHSNGGVLVYRLACDMSDTFAAVASVSGPMMYSACEPTRAVSVLHIHGLADSTVPIEGGGFWKTSPVEVGIETWAALNGCTESEVLEVNNGGMTPTIYSSCQDGTTVELYTIERMEHDWPGQANDDIWDFFAEHPMP